MKYFKIDFQNFYNVGRTPSYAEGEKIPNAERFFGSMNKGEFIENAPLFDYFYLKSFDSKEYWEWKLCDAIGFIGEGSQIKGWFVSKKLKILLEKYNLSKPYHFYPSKLLYKCEKLDYYIFQFTGGDIFKQTLSNLDFSKTLFWNPIKKENIVVYNIEEFIKKYREIYKENKRLDCKMQSKKLTLTKPLDFFPIGTSLKDNIVSKILKNAIEENGITGFEFSELDYEVEVEN